MSKGKGTLVHKPCAPTPPKTPHAGPGRPGRRWGTGMWRAAGAALGLAGLLALSPTPAALIRDGAGGLARAQEAQEAREAQEAQQGQALGRYVPAVPRQPLPDVVLRDGAGEIVDIGAWEGRVVVVNFWATWCPPCVAEMPSLDRLQAAFDPEELTVLAVSVDRKGPEVVESFLYAHDLDHLTALAYDPKMSALYAFGAQGLPATILLDRQGRIAGRLKGKAEWDGPAAMALLETFLSEP